jgi:glutathione peroxidase
MKTIYDFNVKTISGSEVHLKQYNGKVLLVVNVASKCGLTPQYEGLENLYKKYKEQGLEVLGFPANEFLAQEPGSDSEIKDFCRSTYGVEFPMFSKIVVKGEGQHPLYKYLTESMKNAKSNPEGNLIERLSSRNLITGDSHDIKWNFEKFLIDRKGNVVARFNPDVLPEDKVVIDQIEYLLKE